MIFIPNHQSTKVLQPCKKAFDFPSPSVSTQCSTILSGRFTSIALMRCDHLHTSFFRQAFIQFITIVSFVTDQMLRQFFQKTSLQGVINKCYFMRASTGGVNGERKTASVCKAHNFGTFTAFGLSHTIAPFFAGANVPSMKPSLRSIPPRSRKSSANAVSILAKTPDWLHSWKRRWQVLFGGYRSGKSAQGAPVRRIQRIPLSTALRFCGGRPDFPGRALGFGIKSTIRCHCSFVRSIDLISAHHIT